MVILVSEIDRKADGWVDRWMCLTEPRTKTEPWQTQRAEGGWWRIVKGKGESQRLSSSSCDAKHL